MEAPAARMQPLVMGGREFCWGERTFVMGVLNVTPDSFSGDGLAGDVEAAARHAREMEAQGADIIDVGGESTRPASSVRVEEEAGGTSGSRAAEPVSAEEELQRVLPVLRRLVAELRVSLSIDTYKAGVARQAVAAGVAMINDVWGLKRDPAIARAAAEAGVPLVLVHNQEGTRYRDFFPEMLASLARSVELAREAGVPPGKIILDPGFGFGKAPRHSLELLRRLREVRALGYPVLIGTSRKSTIGRVLGLPVTERLEGTAATVAIAIANGADIVRVHDVQAMVRVTRMSDAVVRGWRG